MVRIDSGPLEATHKFEDTPLALWDALMQRRRMFLGTHLTYYCHCLLEFCEEVEFHWKELGYESYAHLIKQGYGLSPEDVATAHDWLQRHKPEWDISLPDVLSPLPQKEKRDMSQQTGPTPSDFDRMTWAELQAEMRAEIEEVQAKTALLRPYMENDPTMTVEQAAALVWRDTEDNQQ